MSKKIQKRRIEWIILFIMITFLIIIGIYRNQYRRLVDDEIFSMGLANTTEDYIFMYNDQLLQYQNEDGWFSGSHFNDYLTVQPNERFSVKNVYQNQARDNHPPLFYLLVNFISSFFPNEMNLLGIVMINIVFLCFMMVLLFQCARKILGDTIFALLPCLCFLLSSACMQMTDYIRMYTMLCFFSLCLIYIHICFWVEQTITRSKLIAISITVCLGGLTHYYFYVFGFWVAGLYLIMQCIVWKNELRERVKDVIRYLSSYVIGGAGAFLCFPSVLHQILKSDMSDKMSDKLKGEGLPINEAIDVLQHSVAGGKGLWIVLMAIAISVIILYLLFRSQLDIKMTNGITIKSYICILAWLFGVCIGYCLMVIKASIYVAWFYLSPVFCPIFLLVSLLSIILWKYTRKKVTIGFCLLICAFSIITYIDKIPEIYQNRKSNQEYVTMISSFKDCDCLYISDNWTCLYGNHLPNMSVMDEVRCITPDEWKVSQLDQLLDGRETANKDIILIFRKVSEQEELLEQLKQQTGGTIQTVWKDEKNAFYRVQIGL